MPNYSLSHRHTHRQTGVVLLIALIALVALTLTGLAMVRSIGSTNEIAGNIAFRQSTIHSSDRALDVVEAMLTATGATPGVLTQKNSSNVLYSWAAYDNYYVATRFPTEYSAAHPTACGTDTNCLKANGIPNRLTPTITGRCQSAADASSIRASYNSTATYDATSGNCTITTIERLCTQDGITSKAWCVQFSNTPTDPTQAAYDQSHGGEDLLGGLAPPASTAVALRVTVRTDGARGTTSYIQAIMALTVG